MQYTTHGTNGLTSHPISQVHSLETVSYGVSSSCSLSQYDKHKSQNNCNSYSSSNQKAPSSRDYSDHDSADSQTNSRFGSRYNYQTNYRTVRKNSFNSQDGDMEMGYSKLHQEGLADRKRSKLFALRIDRMSRVLFPLAFVAFAVTYWVCYYRIYVAELP